MKEKIICSILIIIIILFNINMFSYESYGADTIDSVISGAQSFLDKGTETTINETSLKSTSDFLFYLLLGIAMVLAVIIGMILGIQFMTASVEEKAKIKESLIPYAAGCVVVFGAFGIWKLAVNVLSNL